MPSLPPDRPDDAPPASLVVNGCVSPGPGVRWAQLPGPVGVVSAGRVGATLGSALSAAGCPVVGVAARSEASRARAARFLPGTPVLAPRQVAAQADWLLLAVPDDALGEVVTELATVPGAVRPGQVILHVSGVYGAGVLQAAAGLGAFPVALCPAMTFTGERSDVDRLPGISYAVTADTPPARESAQRVVEVLGGRLEWIEEAARPLYHAAVAHGVNHLVVLLSDALTLLEAAGVEEPRRVLEPIASAALANTWRMGEQALTGPVSRGDARTVARHVSALAGIERAHLDTYCHLARRAVTRAAGMGRIDQRTAHRIGDLLHGLDSALE